MWLTDDRISELLGVGSDRDEHFRNMMPDRADNAMRLSVMNDWLTAEGIELRATAVRDTEDCLEWFVETLI